MKHYYHNKSHQNTNNIHNRKIGNDIRINNIIRDEANLWFKDIINNDIELVSIMDNKIIFNLLYDNIKYKIELSCPKEYPNVKTGFSIKEVQNNENTLKFITLINEKIKDKILSVKRILTYVIENFDKFKKTNKEKVKLVPTNIEKTKQKDSFSSELKNINKKPVSKEDNKTIEIQPKNEDHDTFKDNKTIEVRTKNEQHTIFKNNISNEVRTKNDNKTEDDDSFKEEPDDRPINEDIVELEQNIVFRKTDHDITKIKRSCDEKKSKEYVDIDDFDEYIDIGIKFESSENIKKEDELINLLDNILYINNNSVEDETFTNNDTFDNIKNVESIKGSSAICKDVASEPCTGARSFYSVQTFDSYENVTSLKCINNNVEITTIEDMETDNKKEIMNGDDFECIDLRNIVTSKVDHEVMTSHNKKKEVIDGDDFEYIDLGNIATSKVDHEVTSHNKIKEAIDIDDFDEYIDTENKIETSNPMENNIINIFDNVFCKNIYTLSSSLNNNKLFTMSINKFASKIYDDDVFNDAEQEYKVDNIIMNAPFKYIQNNISEIITSDSEDDTSKCRIECVDDELHETFKEDIYNNNSKEIKDNNILIDSLKQIKTSSDENMTDTSKYKVDKKKYFDNNKLFFDDIYDKNSIYLDLSAIHYNNILSNIDKLTTKSVEKDGNINFIINEIKYLSKLSLNNNFTILPINDNICHLNFIFNKDFFNKESKIYNDLNKYNQEIKLEIEINSKLYPFYPFRMKLISPKLKDNLNVKISNMKYLQKKYWKHYFTIEYIINYFKQYMNNYAEIDELGCYDDLENYLIELSLLTEIYVDKFDDCDNITNINHKDNNDTYWKKGTGYGYAVAINWDIDNLNKINEQHDEQIIICLKNIVRRLVKIMNNNINVDIIQIINKSCLIMYLQNFYKSSILDILKNINKFKILLKLLRVLPNKYLIHLMMNHIELYKLLMSLRKDFKIYLKTNKNISSKISTNMMDKTNREEYIQINNFTKFCKKIRDQVNINEKDGSKINKGDIFEKYKRKLSKEVSKEYEMDFSLFDKLIKEANNKINDPFVKNTTQIYITKEIMLLKKSLPISFSSSIFHRYNTNNIKCHEFLITGPQDTPYDSGCFHFRIYCPVDYPDICPKANIYTTGNGTISFNPNLFSCGKICLSLLNTWGGYKSECWIPNVSTMLQVVLSIQSMIFVPFPYFNEAGYEKYINTEDGNKKAIRYNYEVRLNCMKWAMLDVIKNPIKGFENVIKIHFKLKKKHIKNICSQWLNEAYKQSYLIEEYKTTYDLLCNELDKL